MIRLAVWASGQGSNAEILWRYFQRHPKIEVVHVVCSHPNAAVLDKARRYSLDISLYPHPETTTEDLQKVFKEKNIQGHLLAGYLKPVPAPIVCTYRQRILNIHPSLLPKYGGRGMYGLHVHRAVVQGREAWSGISIHCVTEQYDQGPVLFQAQIPVPQGATPEDLSLLIKDLEHRYYPPVAEAYFCGELPHVATGPP